MRKLMLLAMFAITMVTYAQLPGRQIEETTKSGIHLTKSKKKAADSKSLATRTANRQKTAGFRSMNLPGSMKKSGTKINKAPKKNPLVKRKGASFAKVNYSKTAGRMMPARKTANRQQALGKNLNPVTLYAFVNTDDEWNDGYITRLELPYGEYQDLEYIGDGIGSCGAFIEGDQMHSVYIWYGEEDNEYYLTSYNIESWESTVEPVMGYDWCCLALTYDPTDNTKGFGLFPTENGWGLEFCQIDYNTSTKTTIAPSDNEYIMLATYGNVVYGWGIDNKLYVIDPLTGKATCKTDIDFQYVDDNGQFCHQSAVIDPKTGICYWAALDTNAQSAMYTLDLNTGETSYLCSLDNRQLFGLCIAPGVAEDKAPAVAENLSADFSSGEMSGTITFTAPTKTFDTLDDLTGNLTYTVSLGSETLATGTTTPGAVTTANITVSEDRDITLAVTTENSVGVSPKAKVKTFVGPDYPNTPENLQYSISEDGTITLTWDAPIGGKNGGYVGDLTYKVRRLHAGEHEEVSEHQTETTYSEKIDLSTLSRYEYFVQAFNDGNEDRYSDEVTTNAIIVGDALTVPFTHEFSDYNIGDFYSMYDYNEDGSTWEHECGDGRMTYSFNAENTADDWLITPLIRLEGGRKYMLNYVAVSAMNNLKERMEVYIGKGDTPEAMTTEVVAPYILETDNNVTTEVEFSVDEDGTYNIGFHAISDPDQGWLYMYKVEVKLAPEDTAPDTVTNLTATPGDRGEKTALLEFNAPTKRRNGETLSTIERIEVSRGNAVVKTFDNPTPGEKLSFNDTDFEESGVATWTIIAYNEAGEGTHVSTSAYVGVDVPKEMTKVELTDNITSIDLKWQPVSNEGKNGGYVNPDEVRYTVIDNSMMPVGELYGETSITIDELFDYPYINTDEGTPELWEFGVWASTDAGSSEIQYAKTLVVGETKSLPLKESFAAYENNYWWWTDMAGSSDVWYNTDEYDATGDGRGCSYWTANNAGEEAWLGSQKLILGDEKQPQVQFAHMADSPEMKIVVEALTPKGETITLGTVDYASRQMESWATDRFDIPKSLAAERYFIIRFHGISQGGYGTMLIDDVKIADILDNNLAVSLSAPQKVRKGNSIEIVAKVTNEGLNTASGATITLTAGEFTETSDVHMLASDEHEVIPMTISTTVLTADEVEVSVVVNYPDDENQADNTASAVVTMTDAKVRPVSDLTADSSPEGVALAWVAPEAGSMECTEDFETCSDGTAVRHGEELDGWLAYDFDQVECYNLGYNWTITEPVFSFGIFDPSILFCDVEDVNYEDWAFDSKAALMMDVMYGETNDDWMVSPLLSGNAQTISMFLREVTTDYGPEKMQILYSTTDREAESFTLLEEFEVNTWNFNNHSFNLPNGAKYFALRLVSTDVFGVVIDNISYEIDAEAPVSFRIYRDGVFVKEVSATSYLDTETDNDTKTYAVTAVYADGTESAPVNVNVIPVGISNHELDGKDLPLYDLHGRQVKTTRRGVYVNKNGARLIK